MEILQSFTKPSISIPNAESIKPQYFSTDPMPVATGEMGSGRFVQINRSSDICFVLSTDSTARFDWFVLNLQSGFIAQLFVMIPWFVEYKFLSWISYLLLILTFQYIAPGFNMIWDYIPRTLFIRNNHHSLSCKACYHQKNSWNIQAKRLGFGIMRLFQNMTDVLVVICQISERYDKFVSWYSGVYKKRNDIMKSDVHEMKYIEVTGSNKY